MKKNLLVDLNLVTFHTYFTIHEEKTKGFTIKNTTFESQNKTVSGPLCVHWGPVRIRLVNMFCGDDVNCAVPQFTSSSCFNPFAFEMSSINWPVLANVGAYTWSTAALTQRPWVQIPLKSWNCFRVNLQLLKLQLPLQRSCLHLNKYVLM